MSQGTSIEELEQRIQKAKEAKAKREADAARSAGERKAHEARQATVVVQTDSPCALSMNGDALGKPPAGISKVRVSPGQKLANCVSSEEKVSFKGL